MFPLQLSVLIWVQDWIVEFILIQDLSQLLQKRKFYAASLHCWHVSPSLSRQMFHAAPLHCWCTSPQLQQKNQLSKDSIESHSGDAIISWPTQNEQRVILWWQVFFGISVGCCICRLEIKSHFKQIIHLLVLGCAFPLLVPIFSGLPFPRNFSFPRIPFRIPEESSSSFSYSTRGGSWGIPFLVEFPFCTAPTLGYWWLWVLEP